MGVCMEMSKHEVRKRCCWFPGGTNDKRSLLPTSGKHLMILKRSQHDDNELNRGKSLTMGATQTVSFSVRDEPIAASMERPQQRSRRIRPQTSGGLGWNRFFTPEQSRRGFWREGFGSHTDASLSLAQNIQRNQSSP